jgi:ComF family protein
MIEAARPLLPAWLRRALAAGLDLLLPPRCLGCGATVAGQGQLCAGCWSALRFLQPPWCRICGLPLPHAAAGAPICGACAQAEPPFDRGRAALAYDEASRGLILAFKHGGRLGGVSVFVGWMATAGQELLDDVDVIAPVPLHRWRLLRRGFNQAALLAGGLARRCRRPWCPDLLVRARATVSQQGLSARARQENVTPAAFGVPRRHWARVHGAKVLLVDDVLTTGATLGACATLLRRHGARSVDALALARVVRDASVTI